MAHSRKRSIDVISSNISNSKGDHGPRMPEFFLYTRLNQNDTKNLRKARTNREERMVLSHIFNLKTVAKTPSDQVSKVDLLLLDFHYINYEFTKEHHFSNEKTSTMLAIMDHVFHYMLEKHLQPEEGLVILKRLLDDHSLQRPPYQMFIFTKDEIKNIIDFTLVTLFRHYSLYEFAFKPRIELVLQTQPFINTRVNAPQTDINQMEQMDQDEADKMKAFLGSLDNNNNNNNNNNNHNGNDVVYSPMSKVDRTNTGGANFDTQSKHSMGNHSITQQDGRQTISQDNSQVHQQQQQHPEDADIDWKKVGRVHKKEDVIDDVLKKEVRRLHKAFDAKMVDQEAELEKKAVNFKPKK